ncbi:hypothetical protein MHYP_G00266860 [Metynnis hypsauchen]
MYVLPFLFVWVYGGFFSPLTHNHSSNDEEASEAGIKNDICKGPASQTDTNAPTQQPSRTSRHGQPYWCPHTLGLHSLMTFGCRESMNGIQTRLRSIPPASAAAQKCVELQNSRLISPPPHMLPMPAG